MPSRSHYVGTSQATPHSATLPWTITEKLMVRITNCLYVSTKILVRLHNENKLQFLTFVFNYLCQFKLVFMTSLEIK